MKIKYIEKSWGNQSAPIGVRLKDHDYVLNMAYDIGLPVVSNVSVVMDTQRTLSELVDVAAYVLSKTAGSTDPVLQDLRTRLSMVGNNPAAMSNAVNNVEAYMERTQKVRKSSAADFMALERFADRATVATSSSSALTQLGVWGVAVLKKSAESDEEIVSAHLRVKAYHSRSGSSYDSTYAKMTADFLAGHLTDELILDACSTDYTTPLRSAIMSTVKRIGRDGVMEIARAVIAAADTELEAQARAKQKTTDNSHSTNLSSYVDAPVIRPQY